MKKGRYPIEFAEPSIVTGACALPDFNTQNYSLAAMIAYLLMGRYAYDGPLLDGERDDTPIYHYAKFNKYHKMPFFVFDSSPQERAHGNALGTFSEDQEVLRLWNELPESVRKLLEFTLTSTNALRQHEVHNPSPNTWMKVFSEEGWKP